MQKKVNALLDEIGDSGFKEKIIERFICEENVNEPAIARAYVSTVHTVNFSSWANSKS